MVTLTGTYGVRQPNYPVYWRPHLLRLSGRCLRWRDRTQAGTPLLLYSSSFSSAEQAVIIPRPLFPGTDQRHVRSRADLVVVEECWRRQTEGVPSMRRENRLYCWPVKERGPCKWACSRQWPHSLQLLGETGPIFTSKYKKKMPLKTWE